MLKLLLLLSLAAASFAADAASKTPAAPGSSADDKEVVFRARLTEDLGTLDWNYGEVNPEIVYQLMEGLFRTDRDGKPELAAARSTKWNADQTELTVMLKADRRWSDGSPLCAQQFVDSWARLQSKAFGSPYKHFANVLKSFEAKSCRELKVKFERPSPEAPALLSHYVFFPIRMDQLKKTPKIFNIGGDLLVNGPFRLAGWKANQSLSLVRNPHFGGKNPAIDRVEFYFVPDENSAQVMFEQKKLDWVKDVPPLMRSKKMEASAEFHIFPNLTTFYFGLSDGKSALMKDPAIRVALRESLDRSELPKVLGREHKGTLTWLSAAAFPEVKAPKQEKKWSEAKAKLAEAVKKGSMDIVLRVYSKSSHKTLAEWAQGQWEKKLGVRIPVEVMEGKVYWREIYTNPSPIFLSGVTAPYSHPRAFLQEFLSSSSANWTGWSSAGYDKAVDEERFQDAEDILQASGMFIPLYTRDTVAVVAKKWKGFHVNPLGQVFLEDVSL
jgi:ABC-type oligopeptide transport system substrate-binding subunit